MASASQEDLNMFNQPASEEDLRLFDTPQLPGPKKKSRSSPAQVAPAPVAAKASVDDPSAALLGSLMSGAAQGAVKYPSDPVEAARVKQKESQSRIRQDYKEMMDRRHPPGMLGQPVIDEKLSNYLRDTALGGALKGFDQGATLHYGDELSAYGDTGARSGADYEKALNFHRLQNQFAQNSSPTAYGVGEFLGSFAPARVIGGIGGAVAKYGGALASKVAPAFSVAQDTKNLANLYRTAAESAALFGADTAGRQTESDPDKVGTAAVMGAAVPLVTTPGLSALAENPKVASAVEGATRTAGRLLQKPAQAVDWALETLGNRLRNLGPGLQRMVPNGITSVGPEDVMMHSRASEQLKKDWLQNTLGEASAAYGSALESVSHLQPTTTSLKKAWANPNNRDAITEAVQKSFSERHSDAYLPPAETASNWIQDAIEQTGGNQTLAQFLRATVKTTLQEQAKRNRNTVRLLGAEKLMQDEQVARAIYENSEMIRRMELGLLDSNGFNPKNLTPEELATGTKIGQLGGYGSPATYFTLNRQHMVPPKITIPPTAEQLAEMAQKAEGMGERLTNLATGQKAAAYSQVLGGAGAGFLGGKVGLLFGGSPVLAGMGAYGAEALGQSMEHHASQVPVMLQSALRNTGVLQKMAGMPGKVGQAAQWALQGMAEGGPQGLKSRAFILSQMPEIRRALMSMPSQDQDSSR